LEAFVSQDDVLDEFFIMNLEIVQGDERDRIIFSVGYGPAEDGTISTNLDKIAQSMNGEEEFTATQKSESAVGQAKKKAKRQQRDPAIDPKLQGGE